MYWAIAFVCIGFYVAAYTATYLSPKNIRNSRVGSAMFCAVAGMVWPLSVLCLLGAMAVGQGLKKTMTPETAKRFLDELAKSNA